MRKLFETFSERGFELFLVGGAVRDQVMGKESNDLDFATNALPDQTIAILRQAGLKVIPIGQEFGTIQTIVDGEKVEITTYRCDESYKKGDRKPSVKFGKTIEEDLLRRDFTFNAMAMDANGNIVDPFGGRADLGEGVINTPAKATKAFADDPLRILRCARFCARGIGEPTPQVFGAMFSCRELVSNLSGERIFEELTKILLSSHPNEGLSLLNDCGVLDIVCPELGALADDEGEVGDFHHLSIWDHTMEVIINSPFSPEVRWAALFHDVGKPACRTMDERVHFIGHERKSAEIWENFCTSRNIVVPNKFRNNVRQLIAEHMAFADNMQVRGTRRMLHRLGQNFSNLCALHHADIMGHHPEHRDEMSLEFGRIKGIAQGIRFDKRTPVDAKFPKGTGNAVAKALGLKPGAELGKVMRKLNQLLIDGEITATMDAAVNKAKEITR